VTLAPDGLLSLSEPLNDAGLANEEKVGFLSSSLIVSVCSMKELEFPSIFREAKLLAGLAFLMEANILGLPPESVDVELATLSLRLSYGRRSAAGDCSLPMDEKEKRGCIEK